MEKQEIIRETVLIGQTAPQIEESLRRAGYDHILHAETLKKQWRSAGRWPGKAGTSC